MANGTWTKSECQRKINYWEGVLKKAEKNCSCCENFETQIDVIVGELNDGIASLSSGKKRLDSYISIDNGGSIDNGLCAEAIRQASSQVEKFETAKRGVTNQKKIYEKDRDKASGKVETWKLRKRFAIDD